MFGSSAEARIELPPDFEYQMNAGLSQNINCTLLPGAADTTAQCSVEFPLIRITKFVAAGSFLEANQTLALLISGLLNPRSLKPSGYLQVSIYDENSHISSKSRTSPILTMKQMLPLLNHSIAAQSLRLCETMDIRLNTTASVPLLQGDILWLQLPP